MKLFWSLLLVAATSCSVQYKDPNAKPDEPTPTPTVVAKGQNPNEGICSFSNDPNKGCLKATISGSNLSVGDFQYDLGVIAFARKFDKDLSSSHYNQTPGKKLEFTRQVSANNFFGNFTVTLEGSHTSYSAYHTGLGNLQVNGMAVGYYDVLIAKQFDLKEVDSNEQAIGYQCAVIWSRQSVDIVPGQETALSEAVGQFEIDMFNESCNGATVQSAYPAADATPTPTPSPTPTPTSVH